MVRKSADPLQQVSDLIGDVRENVGELRADVRTLSAAVARNDVRTEKLADVVETIADAQAEQRGATNTRLRVAGTIWALITAVGGATIAYLYTLLGGHPPAL